MRKRKRNHVGGYVFSLSNLERDLYARYGAIRNAFLGDRGTSLSESLRKRRLYLGTRHTLDTEWDMDRFKEELKAVDWTEVFPPEEEIERMIKDHPEIMYMCRSSNGR